MLGVATGDPNTDLYLDAAGYVGDFFKDLTKAGITVGIAGVAVAATSALVVCITTTGICTTLAPVVVKGEEELVPVAEKVGATEGDYTGDLLTSLAGKAQATVGEGSGAVYGTAVHSAFAEEIKALGDANLSTEVSYLNGEVVPYGTAGSVRLDVVEGNPLSPTAIYDLKTGSAALTPSRIAQIQANLPPGYQNIPQSYPQDILSSAVSIDECTPESGPIHVWPGSHREHLEHEPIDNGLQVNPGLIDFEGGHDQDGMDDDSGGFDGGDDDF